MSYVALSGFNSGFTVSFSHMNAAVQNFTEIASGSPGAPDIHLGGCAFKVETSGLLPLSSGWNAFEEVNTHWFGASCSVIRDANSSAFGDGLYNFFQSSDQPAVQPVWYGFHWGTSDFIISSNAFSFATNGHSIKLMDTGHVLLYCTSVAPDFAIQFQKFSINTPANTWQPLVFAEDERYTTIRHNAMIENFRAFCQGASGTPKFASSVLHYSPESVNGSSLGSGTVFTPQGGYHGFAYRIGHVTHAMVPEYYVNDVNSGGVWIRQPQGVGDCFGLIIAGSGDSVRFVSAAQSAYFTDVSFSIQNSREDGFNGTLTEYGHEGVASDFNSLGNNFDYICNGGRESSGTPARSYFELDKALIYANSPVYGETHVPPSTHWLVPTGLYWFQRDLDYNRLVYEFYDGATWWRQYSSAATTYTFPAMLFSTGSHYRVTNLDGVNTATLIYFGY